MNADPVNSLLARLCDGDLAAAEQVFLAYEPYLRKVVRRYLPARLRTKFDSVDVVQSIWADVIEGFREAGWRFTDAAQLRAFLIKATRNRFIDRVRRNHAALEHERPLAVMDPESLPPSGEPRASDVVQADDLWERMLALCPPAHHDVLRLKRQGMRLGEIAARTGLHEGSIRRILRTLARQLALSGSDV